MNFRSGALIIGALFAFCASCRGDFAAEVQVNAGPKFSLSSAWFFANNGFGGNAVARDSLTGKDPSGLTKRVSVSALARAEITAGRGPRSVTVVYQDGESEVLQDVSVAFVYGLDKHGSQVSVSLFDKTGVVTLLFFPTTAPAQPGVRKQSSP